MTQSPVSDSKSHAAPARARTALQIASGVVVTAFTAIIAFCTTCFPVAGCAYAINDAVIMPHLSGSPNLSAWMWLGPIGFAVLCGLAVGGFAGRTMAEDTLGPLSTGQDPSQHSPVPENAGSPRDAEPGD